MKRFNEVREQQLGIVIEDGEAVVLDTGDPRYHGLRKWSYPNDVDELSIQERRFVSQQVLGPLVNEALTQQVPWGRWKTRDWQSWERYT
jgi:hypothetical protein